MTAAIDAPLVAGRYVLGDLLGTGGFCQVHEAYDVRAGGNVAIKRLREDLSDPDAARLRLIQEGRLLERFCHPGIIRLIDRSEGDLPFLALELIRGQKLDAGAGPFKTSAAIGIFVQLLDALSHIHNLDVVHRDLKPSNLLLEPGRCVLIDFGIAQNQGESPDGLQTDTCCVVGTAGYFSPEQVRGETVDARSDLFSAAIILFELLAGRPAFPCGESASQSSSPTCPAVNAELTKAWMVLNVSPSLRAIRPELPPALLDTVEKAMAKTPADRFQSAAEMAEALMLATIPLSRSA